jgi:oligopeptide/dipeptide ABC transporter ATP-binding protein
MYLGSLVEIADQEEIFETPLHPYTKALISAIPIPDPLEEEKRRHIVLEGDIPHLVKPMSGCKFNSRCPSRRAVCQHEIPQLEEKKRGHWVACFSS